MATIKPEGPVKEFEAYLDESKRGWNGVDGLPNFWRNGEDGMVPVDPQRAQSGGLSDAPSVAPDAAPGNSSPVKYR